MLKDPADRAAAIAALGYSWSGPTVQTLIAIPARRRGLPHGSVRRLDPPPVSALTDDSCVDRLDDVFFAFTRGAAT